MEQDEGKQFLALSANLLGQAMRLHDLAVRLVAGMQTPQTRVNALFTRPLDQPAETILRPYRDVLPGIAFGFGESSGCRAILRETPRHGAGNQLQVELRDIGQSGWFSLEVDLPWPSIRPAEHLALSIAASASQELACSATLTALDSDGARCDLGTTNFWIRARAGTARAALEYALPETTPLDFAAEPKLLIFFPVEPFRLDIDYIELNAG